MRPGDRLRVAVPAWWREERGIAGEIAMRAAAPAEWIFRAGVAARGAIYDSGLRSSAEPPIPVISVGNLTVGGTGKTPLAAWLAERLAGWGRRPAVVVRGYGADEIEVHQELNTSIPVLASVRRFDGVTRARDIGADVAVLDDGFQHRRLARQLDLVLVAAERWREPRRLLPRGPWREPVDAVRRADFVLVTRKTATAQAAQTVLDELGEVTGGGKAPQMRLVSRSDLRMPPGGIAYLRPDRLTSLSEAATLPLAVLEGEAVLTVSSLAEPSLFERQLESLGADVEGLAFPDHHHFSDEDVRRMTKCAAGRQIVISSKEAVKLRGRLEHGLVLHQRVEIEAGLDSLDAHVRGALGLA